MISEERKQARPEEQVIRREYANLETELDGINFDTLDFNQYTLLVFCMNELKREIQKVIKHQQGFKR